jgi:hypothetical protein
MRPLLQRHSDLVMVGPWIMIKPVRHVLRGIILDRTGEAIRFRPTWAIIFLCEPKDSFSLNWGALLSNRSPKPGLWEWSDPSLQETLYAVIEQEALPLLRPIETLDDFAAFTSSRERFPGTYLDGYHLRQIVVDVARGDFEAARAICAELIAGRTKWSMPDMSAEFDRITKVLCPLLATNDVAGMVRLLREWEAYSVKQLKLEAIWEPAAFPVERLLQPVRA